MQNRYLRAALIATVGLIGLEAVVRLANLVDVPRYDVDPRYGYVPSSSQSGDFMHRHRWVYNDRHMGVDRPWAPAAGKNIILIGNSIVMGGNPYDQKDKLGPSLQSYFEPDTFIWPVAAGGWTNVNEAIFLSLNRDIEEAADFFVWEYMNGGFGGLAGWQGEFIWPTKRPAIGFVYLAERYIGTHFGLVSELPPTDELKAENVDLMRTELANISGVRGRHKPGFLLLYPKKSELLVAQGGGEWVSHREIIEGLAKEFDLGILDLAADPGWSAALYKDDGVHPTVEGNKVLARILTDRINGTFSAFTAK